VLRCVDLAVSVHRRRAPRLDLPNDLRATMTSRWTLPAYLPLLIGFIGGFLLPIFPGVPAMFSAVTCDERATLGMVWHSNGRGGWSGNFYCVDDKTQKRGDAPGFLVYLLNFDLAYFSAATALVLRALTKRDEIE